jgi:hypothetical protein
MVAGRRHEAAMGETELGKLLLSFGFSRDDTTREENYAAWREAVVEGTV